MVFVEQRHSGPEGRVLKGLFPAEIEGMIEENCRLDCDNPLQRRSSHVVRHAPWPTRDGRRRKGCGRCAA
jgi:hypothetical protein